MNSYELRILTNIQILILNSIAFNNIHDIDETLPNYYSYIRTNS